MSGSSAGTQVGSLYYALGVDDSAFRQALLTSQQQLQATGQAGQQSWAQVAKSAQQAAHAVVQAGQQQAQTAAQLATAQQKHAQAVQAVQSAQAHLTSVQSAGSASAHQQAQAAQAVTAAQHQQAQAAAQVAQAQQAATAQTAAYQQAQHGLAQQMQQAQQTTGGGGFGSNVKQLAAGLGVTAILREGFNDFAQFERASRETFTMLEDSSQQAREQVVRDAESISTAYGIDATEAMNGFYEALSSGVAQSDVKTFMDTASTAAVAGKTTVDTASAAIAAATNAYKASGLTYADAADSMFTAVKGGVVSFEELSQNLADVMAPAAAAGLSFDQMNGAIAAMTLMGTPAAQATTQIRSAIDELSKSGTTASTHFREATGGTFKEYIAAGHTWGEAMDVLAKKAADSGKSVSDMFSSSEAASAALAVSGDNLAQFASLMGDFDDKAGAAKKTMDEVAGSVEFKMNKSLQETKKALREAGAELAPYVVQGAAMVSTGAKVAAEHKDVIKVVAMYTAGVWAASYAVKAINAQWSASGLAAWSSSLSTGANAAAVLSTNLGRVTAAGSRARAALNGLGMGGTVLAAAAIGGGIVLGAQGAGDKDLRAYYDELAKDSEHSNTMEFGLAGALGYTGALGAATANVTHSVFGGLFDDATGYNAAMKVPEDDAKLADAKLKHQEALKAQAIRDTAVEKIEAARTTRNLTAAEKDMLATSRDTTKGAEEQQAAFERLQVSAEELAKVQASLNGDVDLFGEVKQRYTKADPKQVAGAEDALEQARRGVGDAEERVASLRGAGAKKADELRRAERDLMDARERAEEAATRVKEAKETKDNSLSPETLRKRAAAQADARKALARDMKSLGEAGVNAEVLQRLYDVEDRNPGTIRRLVQSGLTKPTAKAINKSFGEINGADEVLARVLKEDIATAGGKAAKEAYEKGVIAGRKFAEGWKQGAADLETPPPPPIKRQPGGAYERRHDGEMGRGNTTIHATVHANTLDEFLKSLDTKTGMANLAGGGW